jgi:diguanylate cyclase (GGDEF)-like protein
MRGVEVQDKLLDEPARLAALDRYNVLDTAPEDAFDKITALIRSVLDIPIAAVSLIAEDRQWFKSRVGLTITETPRCDSFCTHTVQGREPLVVVDATKDPVFADKPVVTGPPFLRSYLGIPLSSPDGYNIGALCALDTKPRVFDAMQIQIMTNFAALVRDELELRLIAQSDFLTGSLTRRAFIVRMEEAWTAFERQGEPTALVFFDIDHFKSVNDTFGHAAGDVVLSAVARTVIDALPLGAALGRLGGEEFAVLLRQTDAAAALAFAEMLRKAITMLYIPDLAGRQLTASFGVAPLTSPNISAAEWLAQADHLMYEAKQAGRNQCRAATSLA